MISTFDDRRLRDWYYTTVVSSLHGKILAWMSSRDKDRFARVDSLLTACERNPDMCAELIDCDCDRLRYINWKMDKKGRAKSCDVVWNYSEDFRMAKGIDAKKEEAE